MLIEYITRQITANNASTIGCAAIVPFKPKTVFINRTPGMNKTMLRSMVISKEFIALPSA